MSWNIYIYLLNSPSLSLVSLLISLTIPGSIFWPRGQLTQFDHCFPNYVWITFGECSVAHSNSWSVLILVLDIVGLKIKNKKIKNWRYYCKILIAETAEFHMTFRNKRKNCTSELNRSCACLCTLIIFVLRNK